LTDAAGHVTAGRVGRAHGLDGSFYVAHASESFVVGGEVVIAGRVARVERVAGTPQKPIVRLSGIEDRAAAEGLRGEPMLVEAGALEEGEYLAADLVGCAVPGVGVVRRVIPGPSCDVLEVGDEGVLIPFISDAVKRVDTDARTIDVDVVFLGLEAQTRP
jgi:16S rRNA processing protein RimM